MANPTSVPSSTPPTTPAAVPQADAKQPVPSITDKKAPVAEDTWDVQEDGKTIKKSRKEILDAYQLRQLSDKKRSEAEKTVSEYNKLFTVFKQDPIKFMKAAGIDFDNLSSSYLAKKAEDSMLDPKDRELKQAKAEAEQYKKWVEEQKTKQADAEKQQIIAKKRDEIHQEIIKAIEEQKELGMPIDEELVIAIAQKMKLQDRKQKPLDAKEGVHKAYESSQKFLQGLASKMDGEALVKWLGDDTAKKIRKYDLAKLKAGRAVPTTSNSSIKPKTDSKETVAKPYKTWSQFKQDTLDKIV